MATERVRYPVRHEGFLFGSILGLIFMLNVVYSLGAPYSIASSLISSLVLFVVSIVLYILPGYRAAAQTGKTGSGLFAGALTGAVAGILGGIATVVLTLVFVDRVRLHAQYAEDRLRQFAEAQSHQVVPRAFITNADVIHSAFLDSIAGFAFAVIFGLVLGGLAGLIGKRRARVVMAPYEEAMYQGMAAYPTGATPPYPPPYPPQGQGAPSAYPPQSPYPPSPQTPGSPPRFTE